VVIPSIIWPERTITGSSTRDRRPDCAIPHPRKIGVPLARTVQKSLRSVIVADPGSRARSRRSVRASTAQGWAAISNRSGASALGQDRLLPLMPMRASSACAFLCRAAFPFVISDVVRYTWLSTGTHPSGWARSPNRALGCGDCSPSFCVLLPGVQGQADPGFGDNSRTRYG